MANKYLDQAGLSYFWSKIKAILNTKANTSDLSTVATSGNYSDLNGLPTIDSTLSDSSTNSVQNKIVKTAIDEKSSVEIVRW